MGVALNRSYPIGGRSPVTKIDKPLYTIKDIEALPEGKRAELIDGVMYMLVAPTTTHQRISGFLYVEFYSYIANKKGECEVFHAPFAVYLTRKYNYVEPDLVVVCDEEKLDEKGCHGAPDLVIEIVSKSSVKTDYILKLIKYGMLGVREYWVIDVEKDRIVVYDFENQNVQEYSFSDKVPVGIYDGELEIDFSKLEI